MLQAAILPPLHHLSHLPLELNHVLARSDVLERQERAAFGAGNLLVVHATSPVTDAHTLLPLADIHTAVHAISHGGGAHTAVHTLLPAADIHTAVHAISPGGGVHTAVHTLLPLTDVHTAVHAISPGGSRGDGSRWRRWRWRR